MRNTGNGGEFVATLPIMRERWADDHPLAKPKKVKGILKYKVQTPGGETPLGETEGPTGPVARRNSESNANSASGPATGFVGPDAGAARSGATSPEDSVVQVPRSSPSVHSATGSVSSGGGEPFQRVRVIIGDADELTRRTLVIMFQLAGVRNKASSSPRSRDPVLLARGVHFPVPLGIVCSPAVHPTR